LPIVPVPFKWQAVQAVASPNSIEKPVANTSGRSERKIVARAQCTSSERCPSRARCRTADHAARAMYHVLSPRGVGYWASPSERGLIVGRPGRLVVGSAARGELLSWAA
jgi:hypothetical protein